MRLSEALQIQAGDVVSLVGAGGKTRLGLRLVHEWIAAGGQAVFTTTTKILEPIPGPEATLLLSESETEVLKQVPRLLAEYPLVYLAARRLAENEPDFPRQANYPVPLRRNKLDGLPPTTVDRLAAVLPQALIVVEADGAKHRLFKAPAAHEPVIPASTTHLTPLADLEVIGCPLTEAHVHRPERVAALTGASFGALVTVEMVAIVLSHKEGGAKGRPPGARLIPALNQREGCFPSVTARSVAEHLLAAGQGGISRVLVINLAALEPVLGVITR